MSILTTVTRVAANSVGFGAMITIGGAVMASCTTRSESKAGKKMNDIGYKTLVSGAKFTVGAAAATTVLGLACAVTKICE